MRIPLLTCLVFSVLYSSSQIGDYVLDNYYPPSEKSNINFEIEIDQNGLIYLANRFGVLMYDGNRWELIPTNSSVLSIKFSSNTKPYVGCVGEFGQVVFENGKMIYRSLISEDSIRDQFDQVLVHNSSVYFISSKNIFSYNEKSKEVKHLGSGDFVTAYKSKKGIVLVDEFGFSFTIIDERLVEFETQNLLVKVSPDKKNTYGLDENGLLVRITNGKNEPSPLNTFFAESNIEIEDIEWVSNELVAFATEDAGVGFFKPADPKYLKFVDYQTGLPDNEVLDMLSDKVGGLWVVHIHGISRIAPLFPAREYSNFEGIKGNIIQASNISKRLWVTTNLGLYYFDQDTSFAKKVITQKRVCF